MMIAAVIVAMPGGITRPHAALPLPHGRRDGGRFRFSGAGAAVKNPRVSSVLGRALEDGPFRQMLRERSEMPLRNRSSA